MYELDTNNHSVFSLHYHLILTIKYRKKVINNPISERLKSIFNRVGEKYNVSIQEWNHDQDHIHVLFKAHPNTHLSKFLNAYKSASSRVIKKEFPELTNQLWKSAFWSQSFCLISVGGAPLEVLKQYIETQGESDVKNV